MLFQVHITIEAIPMNEKALFLQLCEKENVKPVLIELDKGMVINQPMFTSIVNADHLVQVLDNAKKLTASFENAGYRIIRVKVEIDPRLDSNYLNSDNYYEWHCRLKSKDIDTYRTRFEQNNAHLSRNSLVEDQKFVTIRSWDKQDFYQQVEKLKLLINQLKIDTVKEKFEYCIYDSNLNTDKGWA